MSKFNFSFRRGDRRSFRNIAHGLIPAATIAPRPAVPRTPPPRSPNPSPERPRSALAAAILSSSLTGRTVAIPPPRARSYSESDCSRSDSHPDFEPFASTALYTRDRWSESVTGRPRLASPSRSEDEGDEDEEALSDEGHVYQSLETAQRAPVVDPLYALPVKTGSSQLEVEDETEDSAFDIVSPLQTEEEIEVQEVPAKTSPYPRQPRPRSRRSMPSPDLTEERTDVTTRSGKDASGRLSKRTPSKRSSTGGSEGGAEAFRQTVEEQGELVMELKEQTEALERRCSEQTLMIRRLEHELHHQGSSRDRANPAGESGELVSLRQQAQELVDENDGLKMTVHRLSAELSRYQMRFRPLAKDEMMKTSGLPMKGPAPPWLLDMKYLSPLLLAYEDRLGEKDALLKSCEGELKRLKAQAEEVVQENQKLHEQLGKTSAISQKEWRQLQDQARLVLNENQVLIEQLELQHTKAKETSSRHSQEVSKLAKQLMLVEAEKQALEVEVAEARPELQAPEACLQQTRSALHSAVSQEEHGSVTGQLQRQLKEEARTRSREVEELGTRVSALQEERKSLQLNKSSLTAQMKSMEEELERSRQANRKAQRRIGVLKQQVEDSIERELTAHHYLASIVTLAEKTTQERDQLIHMASSLEKDKQGVLARIIEGTVRLGKLQEKVKVFRRQAASSVGGLGRRLRQQEEEFAGRAEGFRTRIQQLQGQLSASRAELEHALRREREVENELEVVWEAATRESQLIREAMRSSSGRTEGSPSPRPLLLSPPRQDAGDLSPCARPLGTAAPTYASPRQNSALPLPRPRRGPAFESDSDQPRNPSSDESERNGMDFYS